ncbi:MAG: family 20 glycosylhydrolase [Neisseria sp.]|uniref:family 20 glycosylhydrolase n=1 Tax=Neisseria sp. TaxID=192066 RepID=UPI0026DB72DD|nr:family 20 glycosylhydrolase [Neisseria sp.]MDO4640158.1 family 20 glycosylhydrolase [Neisseria sp.]
MKTQHLTLGLEIGLQDLIHMQEIIKQSQEIFVADKENNSLVAEELNTEEPLALEEQNAFQIFPENWVALDDKEQPAQNSMGYTHLAENTFVDVTDVKTASDATAAEEVEPVAAEGSSKMPWILGGAGLLLAGVAAAAAGGGSGGGDSNSSAQSSAGQTKNNTAGANSNSQTGDSQSREEENKGSSTANQTANNNTSASSSQTDANQSASTTDNQTTTNNTEQTTDSQNQAAKNTDAAQTTDTAASTDTAKQNTNTNSASSQSTETSGQSTSSNTASQNSTETKNTDSSQNSKASDSAASNTTTTDNTAAKDTGSSSTGSTATKQSNADSSASTSDNTSNTSANQNTSSDATSKQSGLTLDIAKHFYSADVIKKYIDTISKAGGNFLQLHLSDDDNYAFESTVLNQRVENATLNADGTYTNPVSGKQFLSYTQIADVVSYAKAKGVELIPEVDTPNHMDAIFTLLEQYKGADYVKSIKSEVVNDEVKITDSTAISFVKSLYSEVIGLMDGNSKHFHIGGDEFGYSASNNHEFITYANTMSEFLANQGLTTRMWNDGLLKTSLSSLNTNIEITYWSYDGNPTDAATASERRAERASMQDLLDDGFDVLNYNWYYLYFVPKDGVTNAESGAHMASDIQTKWDLSVWDGTTTTNKVSDTGHVIGSSLTIWGENAGNLTDDKIYEWSANGLSALISKTHAESVDKSTLTKVTVEINESTPANKVVDLDDSASELVSLSATDDFLSSGNAFVWLNGGTDDMVTLSSGWTASGASELKGDVSYSLYKNGQNHLYVDTDIAVQIV